MFSKAQTIKKKTREAPIVTIEMIEKEENEIMKPDQLEKCKLIVKQIEPENKKIKEQAF